MEVPEMDEAKKAESHMTSAAAFVEGGVQEACDDSCSICLETFCDSDPSTVTSCKHEFHLQCILEWCQRSSNCPMCWQNISLKDPASQELLEAVERERSFRLTPSRNATILHHPTLGDFELQHLPVGVDDPELEERIIQHLAAAAAMGRTRRIARREGSRIHSTAHAHPEFVMFSAHPNGSSTGAVGAETEPAATTENNPSLQLDSVNNQNAQHMPSPSQSNSALPPGSLATPISSQGISNDSRSYGSPSSVPDQDRAGPSEFQSFPDTWKSRFNSMSLKYKESITRSTRGWKERLFSRSSTMADIGSEVRREVNAGIATVSRMMERNRAGRVAVPFNAGGSSVTERSNNNRDTREEMPPNGNTSASAAASPIST